MKKTISATIFALSSVAALTSFNASADTILGGYVGVQAWQMGASGGFSQNESLASFEFEEEANIGFYAALEHPIPLVPNIKIARTSMETLGSTVLDSQFTFGGEVFLVNANLETQVDLSATDYILYYEILDNDIVSIDVGISGKQVQGDVIVTEAGGSTTQESINVIIPMGYAKAQVGLPLTGLGLYLEASGLAIQDDSFTDYQLGLTYSFVETLAIDLSIQAGYRNTTLDINDVDDIYADIEFDGAFIGIEFDF